jgi:hypothetical protein
MYAIKKKEEEKAQNNRIQEIGNPTQERGKGIPLTMVTRDSRMAAISGPQSRRANSKRPSQAGHTERRSL